MRYCHVLVVFTTCVTPSWGAAPPVPRGLTAKEKAWLERSSVTLGEYVLGGKFEQAEKLVGERVALRERAQGRSHWETQSERFEWERARRLPKVPAGQRAAVVVALRQIQEGKVAHARGDYALAEVTFRKSVATIEKVMGADHPDAAAGHHNVASSLDRQGKRTEAMALYRKALAIREKALGDHPDTAASCNNMALCLLDQRKGDEALPLCRRALAICLKALGSDHPTTAGVYQNVASCLELQDKPLEALPYYRKALAVYEHILGPDHPALAPGYLDVANCLSHQGRIDESLPLFARAIELQLGALGIDHPDTSGGIAGLASALKAQGKVSAALALFRLAVTIREMTLGPDHPTTGAGYNNLALCLQAVGDAAGAMPLHRKALAIQEKARGPNHPDTAACYAGVAGCLLDLGKPAEALPMFRKSLATWEKLKGRDHPATAVEWNNVAYCLHQQGKSAEALPLYRKALEGTEKALGRDHPRTATCYNNVAFCLQTMGKPAEALPYFRKALAVAEAALGSDHRDTVSTYTNLAMCLESLGEHARAVRLLQQAMAGEEVARYYAAASGFERAQALAGRLSARTALATGLARLKQPRNAFAQAEASLARGLLDDMAAPVGQKTARVRTLNERLARLDRSLVSFAGEIGDGEGRKERRDAALRERRVVLAELAQVMAADSARQVLPLSRIQKAMPADTALVLWVDPRTRWACVVRDEGPPRWVHLGGSGKDGAWSKEDKSLAARLYLALHDPASSGAERERLSSAFLALYFDPLRPALEGVKRLFVVPRGEMARVPLEAVVSDYAVSYVPSGSVLARLLEMPRKVDGSSLLALGDPAFDRAPPPEPPASGVLIRSVIAGGHAAAAKLQAGDVLLSIGGVGIDSFEDVQGALAAVPARAAFWRQGKTLATRLGGVPLGAVLDDRSARAAVRAWRRERDAGAQRGTGHQRLPGTRLEVEAIASMVKGSTTLLGSEASEQKLDALRKQGKLKGFRVIQFATHGEVQERSPGRSALILAQDALPAPLEQARLGRHVYDGRLTVERIRATWELDCDLVVLSACDTGLGLDAGGEGLLGFAHAFLSKGARSVVLSRWKVDDAATALLMVRFYENLLGKRKGLKQPMGRAAALGEARKWLRELPRKEAGELTAALAGGQLRGTVGPGKPLAKGKTPPRLPSGERPYEHPYYWAAFTLVGDPD